MIEENEAIVLRAYHLGEEDKIVLLFTRNFGKLKGVAKGAFSFKSNYGASFEPFSHIRLRFSERKELVRIEDVRLIKPSLTLELNPLILWLFSYIAELIDYFTGERDENEPLFRLLISLLRGVEGGCPPLVAACYFELWLLKLTGFMPEIRRNCTKCGLSLFEGKKEVYLKKEGLFCKDCLGGEISHPRFSLNGFLLLKRFFTKPLSEINWVNIPQESLSELREMTTYLIKINLGRELRSLSFLNKLTPRPSLVGGKL
jgi:DNA repair protein RecO (recombination protein O)